MCRIASCALLLAGCLASAVLARPLQRPTPQTLTADELQQQVRVHLKRLVEFTRRVELDPGRLVFRKAGDFYWVIWTVRRVPGVMLTVEEEDILKERLKERLQEIVDQTGLLQSGNELIRYRIEFAGAVEGGGREGEGPGAGPWPGPGAGPGPGVGPGPGAGAAPGVVYQWFYVPPPCGSCGPGYYYRAQVAGGAPSPVSTMASIPVVRRGEQAPARLIRVSAAGETTRAGQSDTLSPNLVTTTSQEPGRPAARKRFEGLTSRDASDLYYKGVGLYWQRSYASALEYLEAATSLADEDARFWYYRTLTELALGNQQAARSSLERAVALHRQGKPRPDVIGRALERIQGPTRTMFREALDRPRSP
jgi:hypothetical protein